jgi:DHA1 family multidrug resistance protein-like MFS transporter
VLSGILFYLLIKGHETPAPEKAPTLRGLVKEANPFSSFSTIKPYMSVTLAIFIVVVLFSFVGLNAYEQSFNYYLKDQFNFSPAYNGALKALVGLIYLGANFSICMWIIKKTQIKLPTVFILLGCGAVTVVMVFMHTLVGFLIVDMGIFALDAVFQPLLQGLVSKRATSENSGIMMGFFSAVRYLAMILGALIAGFTYIIGANIPFWVSAAAFLLAAAAAVLYWAADRKGLRNLGILKTYKKAV